MNLQTISLPNGETVALITLFGANRSLEVMKWHRRVMVDKWHLPVNYIECPFPAVSHGAMMNEVLARTIDTPNAPTYYGWIDNDCIFLRGDVLSHVVNMIANKQTVWGSGWKSAHKVKPRGGDHVYCSQACLFFSREMYLALGKPDCDHHNPRSDTSEEICYAAESKGFTVAVQYPSYSDTHTTELGQVSSYGRGNIYGPAPGWVFHESRADQEGHSDRFVTMAKSVIAGEFEVDKTL